MSWLKETKSDYVGVIYNTSTDNPKAYSYGGHNIAIPLFSPGPDGYCKKLRKIFDLEHAEVNHYDTVNLESLPYSIQNYLKTHKNLTKTFCNY